MAGFKDFLMRGNLIDLAVAVIIGTSFAAVVTTFTQVILDIVGLIGGNPDFSGAHLGPILIGPFINAVVAFVIVAAIIYFAILKPLDALKARGRVDEPVDVAAPTTEALLVEIRDLLKAQQRPS